VHKRVESDFHQCCSGFRQQLEETRPIPAGAVVGGQAAEGCFS
jgi:hypothetical protein